MRGHRLFLHQLRYDQLAFWRNPPAVFFGILLPILFLVIFAGVFGSDETTTQGISRSTYYVPGIMTLGVVSVTFISLAISLTVARESGLLKRLRGTPLPTWAFVSGRVGTSVVSAFLLSAVLMAIGKLLYGADLPGEAMVGVFLTIAVSAASFCTLGFAVSGLIPNEDSAPGLINVIVLPLYFISGIFFPVESSPGWLVTVADIFPIRHFTEALLNGFAPATTGLGIAVGDLVIIAAWGLFGLAVSVKTFRWTPRNR